MHFSRSLLSFSFLLLGVNALPAPQILDGLLGVGDNTNADKNSTSVADATSETASATKGHVLTDTPTLALTPTQTDSAKPTDSAVFFSSTPDATSVNFAPPTTVADPTRSSVAVQTTPTHEAPNPNADLHTGSPATASSVAQTNPTSSSYSSLVTSTAAADNSSSGSSGSNTKTILIIGGTVGGVVILVFLAFSIFRKLKLKPSARFEERMAPSTFNGNSEEWNDPRMFRGYGQNSTAGLGRSKSQASSQYSFELEDEKSGGGTMMARGGTIRNFPPEKEVPLERGDGLREAGRGYRGF